MPSLKTARWISRRDRLAIYLRDNMTCIWCGKSRAHTGIKLTLDHVVPRSVQEGLNTADNLLTSCRKCNYRRQDIPVQEFARGEAKTLGISEEEYQEQINKLLNTPLDIFRQTAESLMSKNGGYTNAMEFKAIRQHFGLKSRNRKNKDRRRVA